jgi:hypothetical protein
MPLDLRHFSTPALEIINLAKGAAIGFGSPASLRAKRRDADNYVRDLERLAQQVFEVPSGLPSPPPGVDLFVPASDRSWRQADAATWRLALGQTIRDLVASCREMVQRCWELGPVPLSAAADQEAVCRYNEAVQRAHEECQSYEAELNGLIQRLWNFGQQMERFPRPGDQIAADAPRRDGLQVPAAGPVLPNATADSQMTGTSPVSEPEGGPPAPPVARQYCFSEWAFGLEDGRRWQTFKRSRGRWEHRGLCCKVPRGRRTRLTVELAQCGGLLPMEAAVAIELRHCPGKPREQLKQSITGEVSRFRADLRKAMGIIEVSKDTDPLPYDDVNHAWQARVGIGYAIEHDGGRMVFRPREDLTPDEQIDSTQG